MTSKNVNVNGRWKRVELTEDETREVLDKLLVTNTNVLQECEEKARNYKKTPTELTHTQVVQMLYDKQATASFTAISSAIDDKAFRPPEPPKDTYKEAYDNAFKTEQPTKPKEPSTIDKAFERT